MCRAWRQKMNPYPISISKSQLERPYWILQFPSPENLVEISWVVPELQPLKVKSQGPFYLSRHIFSVLYGTTLGHCWQALAQHRQSCILTRMPPILISGDLLITTGQVQGIWTWHCVHRVMWMLNRYSPYLVLRRTLNVTQSSIL